MKKAFHLYADNKEEKFCNVNIYQFLTDVNISTFSANQILATDCVRCISIPLCSVSHEKTQSYEKQRTKTL